MPEIGVWITAEGTHPAALEMSGDDAFAQELPGWLTGALKGAAAGAATGAAAGPYGALIGAAAGGALGAATSAAAPPTPAAAPPAAPPSAAPGAGSGSPVGAKPAVASNDTAARAAVVQTLQQFAAMMPTLVQLVAANGKTGKEYMADALDSESYQESASDGWMPELEISGSYWTVP